ncbi:CubicO group peptidase (beta-lactamase class C family) [Nonomuraea fuscirosea]|uniref:CubicO group peptidase (Beta-lactamase class C family) n=1 Tax=Nonomuraea fuscirosea TaxID=1291556 RepID=A0A2T0M5C3_9ACTN|nr:serine hydrolase [Nonomuraea fuscirosea]PRX52688.1 CubicO group peptidase (beta-lactamase class C family) [Nonomuraea fuscirosea]
MTSPLVPRSRREVLHAAAGLGALLGLDLAGLGRGVRTAAAGPFACVARHDLTAEQFQAEWDRLVGLGYRPTHVDGYTVGGRARYAGIWEQAPGPPQIARHGLTTERYKAEFTRVTALGYRPVVVSGFELGGEPHFAAIWEQTGGPPWVARHDLTSAEYQAEFDRLLALGYRLVLVNGYQVGGWARFAAIWEQTQGPAWVERHNLTAAQYQAEFTGLANQGFRPVHVSGYVVGGTELFAAIFEQGDGPVWSAGHDLDSAAYQAADDDHVRRGYRPVKVSGYGLPRFAAIWVSESTNDFSRVDAAVNRHLTASGVAGVSLAIARRGALVFAKGYGLARRDTGEQLTERHVMRIASLSKPITAVAVMRLVESGRLALDQHVFGPGALLGTRYGTQPYRADLRAITLRHLLEHTSGGWPSDGTDPMFTNLTMNQAQLITWVLDKRPLQFAPGTRHMYSNFGYCLLGRIIEQVTGQSYVDQVRQDVLKPVGSGNMYLAGDTLAERRPDEVVYYGSGDPYALPVRRADAHGGWLGSPVDVVRFAVRADGFPTVPDLLRRDTVSTMTTPSAASPSYGLGWNVNNAGNWWHNGRYTPGTEALVVRTANEFCWAAAANGANVDLDAMMWDVYRSVSVWPAHDLF